MARKNPYAKPDRFTRAAKEAGYPARSVFKLEEIDRRTPSASRRACACSISAPLRAAGRMYAAKKIGPGGKLLAVDLEPLTATLPPGARLRAG